jgi:Fe-S-cluster-containing hydrogenase component 2
MIFEMPSCGGCRTCEMVCSFHHKGLFEPSVSSIKILERENGPGFNVWLLEETGMDGIACDGCPGLEEPFCVEYCREKEDLRSFLDALKKKRE